MTENSKSVLLMAGGTGGHVFPALAIAEALQEKEIPVYWLGTRRGLEARVIPPTGIPIHYISISGLRGKGILSLLTAPFKILWAIWQAYRVLKTCQPTIVIGMGGFVTGPGGVAAWLSKIPLIIHEQNAIAGLTNQWLARFAQKVLEAFPDTFPEHYHAIYTGNPIRISIRTLAHSHLKKIYVPLRILIIGGSLGAKILNDIVPQALRQVHGNIEVWHQTGELHIETMRQAYHQAPFKSRVDAFIEDMGMAYQWADLVICRAGALTVSELAQMGVPSILIPYPHAVDDHQTFNARFLADKGGAIFLPQTELTVEELAMLINQLIENPTQLQEMSQIAKSCATPLAVQEILEICLEVMEPNKE